MIASRKKNKGGAGVSPDDRDSFGGLLQIIFRSCDCLFLSIVLTGCLSQDIPPQLNLLPKDQPFRIDWTDWGATLSQVCREDRVDYSRLIQNPDPLNRFLARVAVVGPRTTPDDFPDQKSRLAFWINCYNATILHSMIAQLEHGMKSPAAFDAIEASHRFRIDGQWLTPADLRSKTLKLAGDDWRVTFALCDAHAVGPPLSRRAFLPDLLDGQLDQAVRTALASPGVVFIAHGDRQLLLWRGLYDIKDRLISDYDKKYGARGATMLNVLLDRSDRDRRETLNTAIGYQVAVLPNLGMTNALEAPIPESQKSVFSRLSSFSIIRPTPKPQ